jgi:O6-methylguanine-DNA--protein-cysteine methyltransferase
MRTAGYPYQTKKSPPKGKCKSIIKSVASDDDDDGRLCFATFKEQQDPEKYEKSNKKGGAKAEAPKEEEDMRTYHLQWRKYVKLIRR